MSEQETVPKMQVHVTTLKPWEAVLLIATSSEEPIVATMDRRDEKFDIEITPEDIKIKGGGELKQHDEEARQVRCPGCASADIGWKPDTVASLAHLACRHCDEQIIEAELGEVLDLLSSDVIYESGFDWKML